ncbi:hypothetical protein PENTCL1PPCAC_9421, partial [Pristionchus entomophagus]
LIFSRLFSASEPCNLFLGFFVASPSPYLPLSGKPRSTAGNHCSIHYSHFIFLHLQSISASSSLTVVPANLKAASVFLSPSYPQFIKFSKQMEEKSLNSRCRRMGKGKVNNTLKYTTISIFHALNIRQSRGRMWYLEGILVNNYSGKKIQYLQYKKL